MSKIKEIKAREILNSKGNPTIETTVVLQDGSVGVASIPTGISVGTYEALDLKDHDEKRYRGKGVLKAIENIEKTIAPKLVGFEAADQPLIDRVLIELDGTPNKSHLGANAILSVSIAVCKAAAKSSVLSPFMHVRQFTQKEKLILKIPTPLFNLVNGGLHADGNVDFQEFLVIPASSKPFSEALQNGVAVYSSLKPLLQQSGLSTLLGDEGGYGPKLSSNKDALFLIRQAVDNSALRFGFDIFFGLDVASNSFYKDQQYHLKDKPSPLSSADLVEYYDGLMQELPLLYLEDPVSEDDWEGWLLASSKLSTKTLLVGDDLTVTNPYRLQLAIDKKLIGGIIIKPNQIGTVIESLAVVEIARAAGLKIIVSHRSGETNDDFIADFAVAISADYVKFGAPQRGERIAKYNRLLQIEAQIHSLK